MTLMAGDGLGPRMGSGGRLLAVAQLLERTTQRLTAAAQLPTVASLEGLLAASLDASGGGGRGPSLLLRACPQHALRTRIAELAHSLGLDARGEEEEEEAASEFAGLAPLPHDEEVAEAEADAEAEMAGGEGEGGGGAAPAAAVAPDDERACAAVDPERLLALLDQLEAVLATDFPGGKRGIAAALGCVRRLVQLQQAEGKRQGRGLRRRPRRPAPLRRAEGGAARAASGPDARDPAAQRSCKA